MVTGCVGWNKGFETLDDVIFHSTVWMDALHKMDNKKLKSLYDVAQVFMYEAYKVV